MLPRWRRAARLEEGWPMGSPYWAGFEAAASELAAQRRALIECFGFVLAGTIRADGTPRISPVAAHLVSGDLMLVMIPGTQKARDVLRDSRIVLQSPVTEAAEPGAEFKLRGHAVWRSGPRAGTAGRSPCRPRPAPRPGGGSRGDQRIQARCASPLCAR